MRFDHDAINRSILIKHKAKRFGVPVRCTECSGHGHVFTEPAAKLGLVLWVLHPRKGASRGVHIKNIEEKELPKVLAFLRAARDRNSDRFARLEDSWAHEEE